MYLMDLTRYIDTLNKLVCKVYGAYCESGLYTLKFHFWIICLGM